MCEQHLVLWLWIAGDAESWSYVCCFCWVDISSTCRRRIWSNTSGKIPNVSDFPYPVGSKTKVSLLLKNDNMASSCLTFRLQLSNPMDGEHALEPLYDSFFMFHCRFLWQLTVHSLCTGIYTLCEPATLLHSYHRRKLLSGFVLRTNRY